MSGTSDGEKKSRSKDSGWVHRFKQQNNPYHYMRFTATSISPILIGFGLLLVPLGVVVLVITSDSSSDQKEIHVDYTYCPSVKNSSVLCADFIRDPVNWEQDSEICQCEVEFDLKKPIKGEKLYMYYALKNFHQNIRQYASSRDDKQMLGKIGSAENPTSPARTCAPLDKDKDGKIYFPCGSIANSMFNDSIQLYYNDSSSGLVKIEQGRRGIAWSTDVKYRYKNPKEFNDPNHTIWKKFTKPKDWKRWIWDLDPEDEDNNGIQNEDFIVWMRTAAFSDFRKLYRIITPSSQKEILGDDGLPAGKYYLRINYNYEVASFKGEKGILLAATTIFGTQNFFQGIASVSVGGTSLVLGLLFLACGCSNKLGKGSFTKRGKADL